MNFTFNNSDYNITDSDDKSKSSSLGLETYILIVVYILIFIVAIIGNSLVIFTLVHNKRMRTVTNVFLLNLAVSDLLLALFCMPFTLIPMFMQNFIFGAAMCVMIRYLQGVSVAVSCFTLVAISLERYFGICRPLRSRRWQTMSHSYKVIIVCWLMSAIVMIPVAICTKYKKLKFKDKYKCDEIWTSDVLEKAYTVFLDFVLLIGPFFLMVGAYGCIIYTLWEGIQAQSNQKESNGSSRDKMQESFKQQNDQNSIKHLNYGTQNSQRDHSNSGSPPRRMLELRRGIRHSNPERNKAAKLKVIRMLIVVCLEFFTCWAPLYVFYTWKTFHVESLLYHFDTVKFTLIFVLSYLSTTCNPVTYGFMNRKFRQSFKMLLGCCRSRHIRRFSSHSTSLKFNGTKLSIMRSKHNGKLSPNDKNISPEDHSVLLVIGHSSDGAAV